LVVALFVLASAASYRWPDVWLLVVPGLLPLIGFAPWTGWLTFEELDMLVLAAAAGGYARRAFFSLASSRNRGRSQHASAGVWLLVFLFAVSILVAMVRGFDSAGGFSFGWYFRCGGLPWCGRVNRRALGWSAVWRWGWLPPLGPRCGSALPL
jgi:hypothetical protein